MPDAAPDLAAPDMRPAPTGPQDCLADEWFSTDGPKCNTCPTPALTCNALVLNTTSISASTDTVSFDLNLALLEPISVKIKGQFVETIVVFPPVGEPQLPPQDEPPAPFDMTMMLITNRASFVFAQNDSYDKTYKIEAVEVVDKCGTTHVFNMTGGWKMREDKLTAPLNCVAPAP
jgi:hypothetical protein